MAHLGELLNIVELSCFGDFEHDFPVFVGYIIFPSLGDVQLGELPTPLVRQEP